MSADQDVLAVECAASRGRPYEDGHLVGPDGGYLVIEPRGRLIRCCDTDCLQRFYQWETDYVLPDAA